MSEREVVLQVEAGVKSFGSTKALQGVNLSLKRGDWLALLGPNGAGKTTLVRAIAGRVHLEQGKMQILGEQVTSSGGAVRCRIGIVPQEIALYDKLTAKQNLHVFGTLHGVTGQKLQDQIKWALKWVALEDRADMVIQGFSGGMKRRLNIAAAVLHRPEVILLDEPTVGVDPQSRERIWQMLAELREQGATLLLTTHQLDEAQTVCDRIVIMDGGKTIADGTFNELVAQTIGGQRTVTVRVKSRDGRHDETWKRSMLDLGSELPPLIQEISDGGHELIDLHIQAPSLQAVFLQLTGKELRE